MSFSRELFTGDIHHVSEKVKGVGVMKGGLGVAKGVGGDEEVGWGW